MTIFTGPIVKLKLQSLSIAPPSTLSRLFVGRGREVISFGRVQQRAEITGCPLGLNWKECVAKTIQERVFGFGHPISNKTMIKRAIMGPTRTKHNMRFGPLTPSSLISPFPPYRSWEWGQDRRTRVAQHTKMQRKSLAGRLQVLNQLDRQYILSTRDVVEDFSCSILKY